MTSRKSERASKLVDAMLGVSLLMQGLAEIGQADASRAMIVVAVGGGAFVLLGTMLRGRLEERFRHFHATVSLIEGLMCAFVGAAAARRGTSYIQYAWFVAAVAFTCAAAVKLRTGLGRPAPSTVPAARVEQPGEGQ
jgi:hypothetical protein